MANRGGFSHVLDGTTTLFMMRTICGRDISKGNVAAVYFEDENYSFTKPLCPKCAALRVIAETSVAK